MSNELDPPIDTELDELADTDWDTAVELESPFGPTAEVWGSPCVDFSPAELKLLLAACRVTNEDSLDFIKHAAMDRIADVLTVANRPSPTEAAGGS